MKIAELDLKRVTVEQVGTCNDFFRVHIDGQNSGFLSKDILHGYEAYSGTDWPVSKLIGRSFDLSRVKSLILAHHIEHTI